MQKNQNPKSHQPKVLFAAVPADGHVNPLIPLALHLQKAGYDVAWYTASHYESKLKRYGITCFPFRQSIDVTIRDAEQEFPERKKIRGALNKLKFDLEVFFIKRGPVYYEDMREIHQLFPFDLLVSDIGFTGSIFVKEIMRIPVISIGVLPLVESSRDLPPSGMGIPPASGAASRMYHGLLRFVVKKILLRGPNKMSQQIMQRYGIPHGDKFLFDQLVHASDYLLQSGSPGFEYRRSDMSKNVRFIGPLINREKCQNRENWFDPRLLDYELTILVTQGTIEQDVNKILVPTLEAFKNTKALVICTTGGCQTKELRLQFDQPNIIIEDFIDFNDVMPYADLYITNGGYGGVMLAVEHMLPMVVAGVHEGKNEICTRIGFFKYGVDLKTELPSVREIKLAVEEVVGNPVYKRNIENLAKEFEKYKPEELFEKYVSEITGRRPAQKIKSKTAHAGLLT